MLDATRLTIDWICSCSRRLPAFICTNTEALAGWRSRTNADSTRHGQVHSRAFDGPQTCDGAGELGFERVLIARVLHELADAESGILAHHREAAAAFGQALARELQARIVQALGGHRDAIRSRLEPVWNAGGIQRLRDGSLVGRTPGRSTAG